MKLKQFFLVVLVNGAIIMKNLAILILLLTLTILFWGIETKAGDKLLTDFLTDHLQKIESLQKKSNLASWQASISGKSEDFEQAGKLELEINQIYSNPEDFAYLKKIKESGQVKNAQLARQLDILYNSYLKNQMEPELLKKIVDLGSEIEKKFNTFRGTIQGEKVSSNDIGDILKSETDTSKRKEAWLASKQAGVAVAEDVIKLVKLRNQAAKGLGFNNYHTFALTTDELDVAELDWIFNQLYELTNEPFAKLKTEMDSKLADRYDIDPAEILPWHYLDPFFQDTPLVSNLDLDIYYKDKIIKELATKYFAGIGLPVESILKNSDLYERDGKNPHAFSTDIDRSGDVRILCNLKNNENWMSVLLHELGHAAYDKYNDPELPYLLRQPAHSFTTEGIAQFFGRLSYNPAWMQQMLGLSDEQRQEIEKTGPKYARHIQLIFARWSMVMYNFEKQLYADPDQDLNSLWWQMVEKYQFVKKPADRDKPDWAAKIHLAIYPCYYHNYLLGELFASQLHHHLVHNVLMLESDEGLSYIGRDKVGDFIRREIFKPGVVYQWNEMITKATGEVLTPKYFVAQFVKD